MSIEQRQYERITIPGDVIINHRISTIFCKIENISNYGAYLKVENPANPSFVEIGDNVSFRITAPEVEPKELSGQILRKTVENQCLFLAVYFMQPYYF